MTTLPLDDLDDLRDRLLEVLDDAEKARANGHYVTLSELTSSLRQQCKRAQGGSLAMLEIALQAVESMAGTSLPPEEIALRSFIEHGSETALDLLDRLSRFEVISPAERQALSADESVHWGRLEELGVVLSVKGGHVLNRRSRALAYSLIEPPVLRSWRQVEESRGQIAYNQLDRHSAVALLETRLGLSPGQARHHLDRHPLERAAPSAGGYRRQPWSRHASSPAGARKETPETRGISRAALLPRQPPSVTGYLSGRDQSHLPDLGARTASSQGSEPGEDLFGWGDIDGQARSPGASTGYSTGIN